MEGIMLDKPAPSSRVKNQLPEGNKYDSREGLVE
jgi:hypothetical protein